MSHVMSEDSIPSRVLECQPDTIGNTRIAALVTPERVYISAHGSAQYNSVILTVDDLDRIRTEMCRLESVK